TARAARAARAGALVRAIPVGVAGTTRRVGGAAAARGGPAARSGPAAAGGRLGRGRWRRTGRRVGRHDDGRAADGEQPDDEQRRRGGAAREREARRLRRGWRRGVEGWIELGHRGLREECGMVVRLCIAVDRRSSVGPGRTRRRAVLARWSASARESLLRTTRFPGTSQPAPSRSTAGGSNERPGSATPEGSSLGR